MFMYSICVQCVIIVVLPLSFPLPSLATLFSLSSSLPIVCSVTLFSLSFFSLFLFLYSLSLSFSLSPPSLPPSVPPSVLPSVKELILQSVFTECCTHAVGSLFNRAWSFPYILPGSCHGHQCKVCQVFFMYKNLYVHCMLENDVYVHCSLFYWHGYMYIK